MKYTEYLLNDVIKFWADNSIDYENGGIFTSLDRSGQIYGTDKSVWFQGRALWVFSKVYNIIDKSPLYLNIAENIYNFLDKCTDTDDRMYFTVTKEGKPLQKRRYYFSETFAAIGCAEYYKATGNKSVLKKAEYYFNTAYNIFKNPSLTQPKINPFNAPFKALAPCMIMLNTAQIMKSTGLDNDRYQNICRECVDEILHGGYLNTEIGALLENVTLDGKFYDSPNTRIVNPGHSLECAWFLMVNGMIEKNDEAINAAKKIIEFSVKLGEDKKHGGIIAFTDCMGKPPVQLEWDMKLWWPQCEAIISNKIAYEIFREDKYLQNYERFSEYAFKNFADNEFGEWYGYLHYDNTVSTTLKGNIFKGPFHIPRLLMILSDYEVNGNLNKYLG